MTEVAGIIVGAVLGAAGAFVGLAGVVWLILKALSALKPGDLP